MIAREGAPETYEVIPHGRGVPDLTASRSLIKAALRNRNSSFVIDGETVLLGADGRS